MRKIIITGLVFLYLAIGLQAKEFENGARVLFLGDSITRAGAWHSQIALFYQTRFPEKRITWLNAGISGDTSAGALKRLKWDVLDRNPSTVVIMLGMNDAARDDLPIELGMGEVGSDKRIVEYTKNMRALIKKLQATQVRIILCTPSPYDATVKLKTASKPAANQALTQMAAFCRELSVESDVPLVDFNGPMNAITMDYQKTHPTFSLIGSDRVHPGALGTTVMAHIFLKAQGVSGIISEIEIDISKKEVTESNNARVSEVQINKDNLSFTLFENTLPMPFEGEAMQALKLSPENELNKELTKLQRPADAYTRMGAGLGAADNGVGIEFNPANSTAWDMDFWRNTLHRQMVTIKGLAMGEYDLLIDGQTVGRWFNDELALGINLSGLRKSPQYRQAQKVSSLHDKHHQLASSGPRMVAYTRHFALEPAGIDPSDLTAAKEFLENILRDPAAKDRLELGDYTLTIAKQYLKHKPNEEPHAKAMTEAEGELYKLNKPTSHCYELRGVTHPLSIEQRQAEFDSRRNPEKIAVLGKEFLSMLSLDDSSLLRTNLRHRPRFEAVAKLAKENKPTEALEAYRDYVFDKLRNSADYGIPNELLDPYKGLINPKTKKQTITRAEELLAGNVIAQSAPTQPGSVWLPRPKEMANGVKNPWSPATFEPLVAAYLITGEKQYLTQWIHYLEDWAMFENTDDFIRGTDISDTNSHSVGYILGLYKALGGIARMQPADHCNFPADALARILSKSIRVYMPLTVVYHDSNPQNWTPGNTSQQMQAVILMDEFKASEYFFHRARNRHENYGTIQNLPDGAETEHALWYNAHYFDGAISALELTHSRSKVSPWTRPSWEAPALEPNWDNEQRSKIVDRARYFLQMLTPQSQYPIGNRSDQRTLPDWKSTALVNYAKREGGTDLGILLNTLRGNSSAGRPDFTMSGFPFSGSWIMRSGWTEKDGYGHFFCSPYPVGGHAFRGLKSNNSLYLSYAGQDLLVTGGFGSYSYDRSPLQVDGKEQFFLAGIGNPGFNKNHKGFGVAYINPQPAPWRSHSSDLFDIAEGVYNGPYGDFVDDHHDNKDYRSGFLAERARSVINGVSHRRQVLQIKNTGLWIVVDRMESAEPHEYSLNWYCPAPLQDTVGNKAHNKYKGKTFEGKALHLDNASSTIHTSANEMPNLYIRHFGPKLNIKLSDLRGESIKGDYTYHYKMYDFWHLSSSWQSKGKDTVISLLEVVEPSHTSKIKNIRGIEGGFEAEVQGGKTLHFQANGKDSILSLGEISVVLAEESYEQTGDQRVAIFCPIAPVVINPQRNIIHQIQPISLSCSTAEVDIRYTLDETEPTIHSPLYKESIMIDNSVTVKARAFRKGLASTPTNLAGTHATVTSRARYNFAKLLEPVALSNDKLYTEGLKAEYFEGDWKDLVFFPERAISKNSLIVRRLFDHCNPIIDKSFGWTYSGFISIPEDGVYTFHAPEEFVTSPQEPGYNLRLFVGQEMLVNNRPSGELNEWYPTTTRHAYGTWSIALKKGLHPIKVNYVDYRLDAVERLNHPGLRLNTIWDGKIPELKVSGPGIHYESIPNSWFKNRAPVQRHGTLEASNAN